MCEVIFSQKTENRIWGKIPKLNYFDIFFDAFASNLWSWHFLFVIFARKMWSLTAYKLVWYSTRVQLFLCLFAVVSGLVQYGNYGLLGLQYCWVINNCDKINVEQYAST